MSETKPDGQGLTATVADPGHPYITRSPGVCGGSATIAGTRIPVRVVVGYVFKQDMLPEEFVRLYPSVTLAQVYAALSYYHDHRDEVERDIAQNSREAVDTLLGR